MSQVQAATEPKVTCPGREGGPPCGHEMPAHHALYAEMCMECGDELPVWLLIEARRLLDENPR